MDQTEKEKQSAPPAQTETRHLFSRKNKNDWFWFKVLCLFITIFIGILMKRSEDQKPKSEVDHILIGYGIIEKDAKGQMIPASEGRRP